jgi:hypothetical protein
LPLCTPSQVLAKAIEVATHSWEYGSVAQALLEWNNSTLSIWNTPFPNNDIPTLDYTEVSALEYVKPFIRTNNITLVDGDGKIYSSHSPQRQSAQGREVDMMLICVQVPQEIQHL